MSKVTYKAIKNMPEVNAYIEQGNRVLGALGFTEHSRGHAVKVAETAGNILEKLGYNQHTIELARIAGYMHDMGNCVNRVDHAHSSAIMAFQILRDLKAPDEDIAVIVSAIGQHDEATGMAVDAVSAALILADKTDVRRNRVRNTIKESFDKHDRVNYAAVASSLHVNVEKQVILLEIELDGKIVPAMVYVMTPGHSFGIPSDYYSNVIWQGYETAGFETQFLEDAIEHAYQLVQKQEREGDFYQQSLFHMGGYDGMK